MSHCIAGRDENAAVDIHQSVNDGQTTVPAASAQRDTGTATGPSWYTLTSGLVAVTMVTLFSIETPTRFVFTIKSLF